MRATCTFGVKKIQDITHKKICICGGGQGLPSHLIFCQKQLGNNVLRGSQWQFTLWVFRSLKLPPCQCFNIRGVWHSAPCVTKICCVREQNVVNNAAKIFWRPMCVCRKGYQNVTAISTERLQCEGCSWVICFDEECHQEWLLDSSVVVRLLRDKHVVGCFVSKHWIRGIATFLVLLIILIVWSGSGIFMFVIYSNRLGSRHAAMPLLRLANNPLFSFFYFSGGCCCVEGNENKYRSPQPTLCCV